MIFLSRMKINKLYINKKSPCDGKIKQIFKVYFAFMNEIYFKNEN